MIRALQTVGWSLLAPDPIHLEDIGVISLVGKNGSGKSSALDALKAVLGARRFGAGRTAGSYRFAGRAGHPASRHAYVLCVMSNRRPDGEPRLAGYGEEITVIMEAGPNQRRYLVVDGRLLLDPADLGKELMNLRSDRPRSDWMRPSDYERRILLPLGFGPAVRRLLEIPQGDVQKALDRDPKALVGLLVELAGGRDAADAFTRAQGALEEARGAHAEARRRVDRRRAELAERQLRLQQDARATQTRARLAALHQPLAAALDELRDQHDIWQRQQQAARAAAVAAARPAPQVAITPEPHPQVEDQATSGIAGDVERLDVVDWEVLRRAGVRVVTRNGMRCVHPDDRSRAAELLGAGLMLPVSDDALSLLMSSDAVVCGPRLGRAQASTSTRPLRAAAQPARPVPPPADVAEPAAHSPVDEQLIGRLRAAVGELANADLRETPAREELPEDPNALLGMLRAWTADGIPPAPRGRDSAQQLADAQAMLHAETAELDTRVGALDEAARQLTVTRAAYEDAVARALEGAAGRFGVLCRDAGLDGRMSVNAGPDGPQVMIAAAEGPGEELRPLWGSQASLSGGWRATVVVLALLACLDSQQALGALLLDEVGASLDESRLGALGLAFARLADTRGLQTIMTLPTSHMSEAVAEFSCQQIGFLRPLPAEPLAPPPHIATAARALRSA